MTKYIDIVNKEKREATIRLYGLIGEEINGDYFAQELASLDRVADTVHLHINSPGGSVQSGLSIISAMISMKAFVVVHVDGIAASMSAVIAVCGDHIQMMDFAKLMIHDPYFEKGGSEDLSGKDRKALDSVTSTLRTILSRRGCAEKHIAKLMTDETWFTADEALKENLIDEVVSSKRKKEFTNLSTDEILSRIGNEYKPTIKNETMDLTKIAAELGLPSTATEAEVLAKITEVKNKKDTEKEKLIADYLAFGKTAGTVTEANEARMKRLAVADFELFAEMVTDVPGETEEEKAAKEKEEKKPETQGRLSEAIAKFTKGGGTQAADNVRGWDWYQKNDPQALAKMENENPKLFNALLDAYENNL